MGKKDKILTNFKQNKPILTKFYLLILIIYISKLRFKRILFSSKDNANLLLYVFDQLIFHQNNDIIVTIKDYGVGMQEDEIEKAFERFWWYRYR